MYDSHCGLDQHLEYCTTRSDILPDNSALPGVDRGATPDSLLVKGSSDTGRNSVCHCGATDWIPDYHCHSISHNDIAGGSSGSSSCGGRRGLDHHHLNDFGEYDDYHNFDCHKWWCCNYYDRSALDRRDKLCDDKRRSNSNICASQYEHADNESNSVNCNRHQLDDVRRHFLAKCKRSDSYCEHNYIVNVDHQ